MKTVANFFRWLANKIDKPKQFTSSTTWHVPAETRKLRILYSGGGGGGAPPITGAGGGGSTCVKTIRIDRRVASLAKETEK